MSILKNIAQATIAVAAAPVAAVVDVVCIIPDACSYDPRRDLPFSRTATLLKMAGERVTDAVKDEGR